jgi:wyosine [tRNA(Phe)-imidazoG37] synthetase (radical SAM superfamily)
MAAESLIFTKHARTWRENRYVYPVISRRSKGLSVGVNLNPDKACNFDCVYCCVDRTQPAVRKDVDLRVLAEELDQTLSLARSGEICREPPFDQTPPGLRVLRDVAFSGDGEPTSYARFAEACRVVADALFRHQLREVKVVLITNATLLQLPEVKDELAFLDGHNGEIWAKLDAGTEAFYQRVERTHVPFRRVLGNILDTGRVRPIVIQSLFTRLHGEPPPAAEIDAYVARLRELLQDGCRIKLVQVYTIARATAERYVRPLEAPALDLIAERVQSLGLAAEVFPEPR